MVKKCMSRVAQQEIVGFVLIVVLVVIALMVFLLISITTNPSEQESVSLENTLQSIMTYTTSCAPEFVPQYNTYEDLFKGCFSGEECNNLGVSSCEYLNESLSLLLASILKTESAVSAYQIDFLERDDSSEVGIMQIVSEVCSSQSVLESAQQTLIAKVSSLVIRMRAC